MSPSAVITGLGHGNFEAAAQACHTEYMSQGRSHAGIILAARQRYSIGERIRRLQKLIAARSAKEMENRFEFLSDWG